MRASKNLPGRWEEMRGRQDRKRRREARLRREERAREERLLLRNSQTDVELTPDELLSLLPANPKNWRPMSDRDWRKLILKPGDLARAE